MRKSEIVFRKESLLSRGSLHSKRSSCCTNPITSRLKCSLPFLISGYDRSFCKIKESSVWRSIIKRSSANYFAEVRCCSNNNVAELQWKLNIWRQLIFTATGLQDELDEGNQRLLRRICKVLQPLLAGVLEEKPGRIIILAVAPSLLTSCFCFLLRTNWKRVCSSTLSSMECPEVSCCSWKPSSSSSP